MKLIILFLFFLLSFLIYPPEAFATNDYEITSNVEYKILDSGLTLVTYTVNITNLTSYSSPKKFLLHLDGTNPQNIKAYESGRLLRVLEEKKDKDLIVNIEFTEYTVGKGNTKTFIISYEDSNIAQKNGEVWEIIIPKLERGNPFIKYSAILSIPEAFGDEAYISVKPKEKKNQEGRNIYIFDKENIEQVSISAGFGKFQVFALNLKYHLKNDTNKKTIEHVAIPPDTATQKLFYKDISPKPENIDLDEDGNWIAKYVILSKGEVEVNISGWVQTFSRPIHTESFKTEPDKNLSATSYWQSDSQEIKAIASRLENSESIYNYVSKNLKYNFLRSGKINERLGAIETIKNPENSLCMEYTDLFIALARANKIPAREINGFAYSQNSETEPLSLVSDVLHSWPEYWDKERNVFVPTDPTWSSTSGGADYFKSFDLKHIAFVIHGQNSVKPYGFGSARFSENPRDDITVSFGELPDDRYPKVGIAYFYNNSLPLLSSEISLFVKNEGYSADYANEIEVVYPGQETKKLETKALLPFSQNKSVFTVNYGFLGFKAPNEILVRTKYSEIKIPTKKGEVILNQLLVLLFSLLLILVTFQARNKLKYFSNKLRNVH